MTRFTSIVVLVLTILLVIFIVQNAETVKVSFFAWAVELPKALLMILCAGVGFLIGLTIISWRGARGTKQEKDENAST